MNRAYVAMLLGVHLGVLLVVQTMAEKKIVLAELPELELGTGDSGEALPIAYETDYDGYTLPFIARDLDFLLGLIERIGNPACRQQCQHLISGLHNLTTWAVEFYDASGKLPEGILSGSTYHLGNFDECLGIGTNIDDETPLGIRGQYCLSNIKIGVPEDHNVNSILSPMWKKFMKLEQRYDDKIDELHWGICVPNSCTNKDVEEVIEMIFANTLARTNFKVTVKIPDIACYKDKPLSINAYEIAYLAVISLVIVIIILGTIFDICYLKSSDQARRSILAQILLAFSMPSNLRKLCSPAHDEFKFDCISGMKFLAMVFIIAGHTLIFVVSGPILNKKFWHEAIGKVENSVFLNNPLLVDTFLLFSGFLFSRILLQELDKQKSVNFILLYFYRYLRLTPAYMVMVGLYVTWLPKLDSGPLWSRMKLENERCLASWWANILYINNYVNTDHICMFQSWYLSVDTQLFVLAPAIIYPLWRWRKLGHVILATVTIISTILPFIMTLVQDLDPTLLIYTAEVKDISTNEYFKSSYIKTHMRASAYCFGILYGYIVYRIQNSDKKISKNTVACGWLVSSFALLVSMCSISVFYGPRKNFTTVEAAFYSSMHRALWSVGTGWVLLACITDNSGPLRKVLKWRPFIPLSRLTYSAYLVNGLVELHSASTIRTPQYLNNFSLFGKILSHLMLTLGGAVLLSIMFESPILGLERIFLHRGKKLSVTLTKKTDSEETTTTEA
ncbi:PREDICTED: nose resistant to fluoxetine protein 6-like [Ceratosolen solmsi marchali]|uniref:Nose resistant to fluoxetine protein 6-like n=1 Tax=Ceratosolen solmsi marchali TaxID=326594 RepID=A0AAJ6VM39_9HYME|nr:PREDICTED: nose resistant to fluoxetine protein 6-like [Ceratosolen solmsi marchali]